MSHKERSEPISAAVWNSGCADGNPGKAGTATTSTIPCGEFGRTPVSESGTGRDHNPYSYTMWMASGGVKGGLAYGATDEFGFKAVENRVSIHVLHATILNQLGMDHTKLTYRYAGRDFRLTDVYGEVVGGLLS